MLELSVCVALSRILPGAWTAVKSLYAGVRWESGMDGGLMNGKTLVFGTRDSQFEDGLCHFSGIWSKLNFFLIRDNNAPFPPQSFFLVLREISTQYVLNHRIGYKC